MKTATFPSLRVDPDLRRAAEDALEDDETLSSFVEESIRANIARRKARREFLARGLARRDEARRTGAYYPADRVLADLDERLEQAESAAEE